MSLRIIQYEDRHIDAVKRLNARFAEAGETWQFPQQSTSAWLPETDSENIFERFYVAEDGDEIRGGYILKQQPFWIEGRTKQISCLYLPLSEGIIDLAYRSLGLQLIHDALTRNPLTLCLGMGGSGRTLPKVLKALGWRVDDLPFFFIPIHANRFLSNLQLLQNTRWKRTAVRLASASGVATAVLALVKTFRRAPKKVRQRTSIEVVDSFGAWADCLWSDAKSEYALCADRQRSSLNRIYHEKSGTNRRVLVKIKGEVVGWFVARSRLMDNHNYFGNMRVGSIIDALARPGYETDVIWASRQFLIEQESDIIVCNLQHRSWRKAAIAAGFFKGPSNFALALSPELRNLLEPEDDRIECTHFMRGDGEGPSNL